MAKDSVTLVLNGEVTLEAYSKVIGGFINMMKAIGGEVAQGAKIDWIVSDLQASSAITTIRGEVEDGEDDEVLGEVVDAFEQVGLALQSGRTLPFPSVAMYTPDILGVMNGRITSIGFQTDDVDSEVTENAQHDRDENPPSKIAPPRASFGTVRGRVESMTQRHGHRFTLYELHSDRAVSCHYEPAMETRVISAYGKVAIVEGWIRRNPSTGLATSVRDIKEIIEFPTIDRTAYRQARGAAPNTGGITPEAAIRKVRDG